MGRCREAQHPSANLVPWRRHRRGVGAGARRIPHHAESITCSVRHVCVRWNHYDSSLPHNTMTHHVHGYDTTTCPRALEPLWIATARSITGRCRPLGMGGGAAAPSIVVHSGRQLCPPSFYADVRSIYRCMCVCVYIYSGVCIHDKVYINIYIYIYLLLVYLLHVQPGTP